MEVPSDSGITFNVQPKMKAVEIAEKARDAILSGKFQQVINSLRYIRIYLILSYPEEINTFTKVFCFSFRYVLTYQMGTWWGIRVISRPQLLLARLLMKLSRYGVNCFFVSSLMLNLKKR